MFCGLSKTRRSLHTVVRTFDCGLGDQFINPIVELMVQSKEEGIDIVTDGDDDLVTIILSDHRVSPPIARSSPSSRPSPSKTTKGGIFGNEILHHQQASPDKSAFTVKHAFPNSSHMRLLLKR